MNQLVQIPNHLTLHDDFSQVIDYAFILVDGFSGLDLALAIETLSIANRCAGRTVYRWQIVSTDGENVRCSSSSTQSVDGDLHQISKHSRSIVLAFDEPWNRFEQDLVVWLRKQYRSGAVVGAIGTGSIALHQAGLLLDKEFTLHWSIHDALAEIAPCLSPARKIYTKSGRIFTCGGGQSTADLMISLIEADIGRKNSVAVADFLLGPAPRPDDVPQRVAASNRYDTKNPVFLWVVDALENDLLGELSIDDIAEKHNVSRRQLERIFHKACGMPPAKFIRTKKLELARSLLENTDMSIMDVAVSMHFGSASNFSKSFERQYGCLPSRYRA